MPNVVISRPFDIFSFPRKQVMNHTIPKQMLTKYTYPKSLIFLSEKIIMKRKKMKYSTMSEHISDICLWILLSNDLMHEVNLSS